MLRFLPLAFCLISGVVEAAQFSRNVLGGGAVVLNIFGELDNGDGQRFVDFATDKEAIVFLESPGGNVIASLIIGEHIRAKGYGTFVMPGAICASACGLIWLAGRPRGGTETSKLGFHAVSRNGDIVSSGNALVGAYLNKLGMNYRAVEYITDTAPKSMAWLTFEKAKDLGIDILPVDASRRSEPIGLGGHPASVPNLTGGAIASVPRQPDTRNYATSNDIRLTCAPLVREGSDPVVIAEVSRVSNDWTVMMTTARGAKYDRGQQYRISRTRSAYSWQGVHAKRPDTTIIGEVSVIGGHFFYSEKIYSSGNIRADLGYRCDARR